MITTTLNALVKHGLYAKPGCHDTNWHKLLAHLGKTEADDEPLALETILDTNGLCDALSCARVCPEHDRLWRLFAVWCVRQIEHVLTHQRSIAVLDVAERFANGDATKRELDEATHRAYQVFANYGSDTNSGINGITRGCSTCATTCLNGISAQTYLHSVAKCSALAAGHHAVYDLSVRGVSFAACTSRECEAGNADRPGDFHGVWDAAFLAARDAQTAKLRAIFRGEETFAKGTPPREKDRTTP